MNKSFLLALACVLTCVCGVRAQIVVGDVTAVGFRASTTNGTGTVARPGQWTPMQVHLTVQGSQLFQGQLRFEAADIDGDLLSFIETPVTVTGRRRRQACLVLRHLVIRPVCPRRDEHAGYPQRGWRAH